MADDFHDALADLIGRQIGRIVDHDDGEHGAVVVAALADSLGKVIAIVGKGDPGAIDAMLIGAEGVMTEVATEMGGFVAAVKSMAAAAGARK